MLIVQTNCTQIVDGHPNLSTAEERFAWLMAVQKIVSIFSEKVNYDFNPLKLLEEQAKIVGVLRKNPSYSELLSKKTYHEICITPPEGGFIYSDVQIKSEVVEAWKTELKRIQTSLGCHSLEETIEKLMKALPDEQGMSDILNESVRALTFSNVNKKCKKNIPKKSKAHNEAIVSRIRKQTPSNFPQEIINAWEEFQDVDPSLLKNFEALAGEQTLCNLLELWLVLDKQPHLDQLNAADLIYFSDAEDAIKPKLDSFKELKNQEALSLKIGKHLKSYASQTTCAAKVANTPIILTQEPPAVAIFRGCAGNDCSSQRSFPYPNDPNERVFFIYGEERALKGYVSAVEVMIRNEPALYVITANGSHLSAGDMEMIFQGLEAEKAQLGVNHIVLPDPRNIGALINFPAPKEVYYKYTDRQPLVSVEYNHPDIRRAIESFYSDYSRGYYDHSKYHTKGVIFTPKKQAALTVKVCPMIPTIQPQDLSQASPTEIVDLLIPMYLTGQGAVMDQMLYLEKVAQKVCRFTFKAFIDQLHNGNRYLSTSEWKNNLQGSLWRLNVERGGLEDRHPELLYPGILYRSDRFSPENIEQSAKAMVADMKANGFKPKGFSLSDLSDGELKKLNDTAAFKQLIALLATRLTDADANGCYKVLKVFSEIKPADSEIHQIIAGYLRDQHPDVRAVAALALGKIEPADPEIHQIIAGCLQDQHLAVRAAAATALGEIKPAAAEIHQALVASLQDEVWRVSDEAAKALGKIKPADVAVHRALVSVLRHSDRVVRAAAKKALIELMPTAVAVHQDLVLLLRDPEKAVRVAARQVLIKLMPTAVEVHQDLAWLLLDPDLEVAMLAKSLLIEFKPTDAAIHRALFLLLKDLNPGRRLSAIQVLGEIQPSDVNLHWELTVFLQNPSELIRMATAEALGKIKPEDVDIHHMLAELVQDPIPKVRIAAVKALGEIPSEDDKIDQALKKTLTDFSEEVRVIAGLILRDRASRYSNRSRAHHASKAFRSRGS